MIIPNGSKWQNQHSRTRVCLFRNMIGKSLPRRTAMTGRGSVVSAFSRVTALSEAGQDFSHHYLTSNLECLVFFPDICFFPILFPQGFVPSRNMLQTLSCFCVFRQSFTAWNRGSQRKEKESAAAGRGRGHRGWSGGKPDASEVWRHSQRYTVPWLVLRLAFYLTSKKVQQ